MLSDLALKKLKPKATRYKVSDRDGIYASVSPTGAISFRFDYRINGRRETLTLGPYGMDGISLAAAREKLIDAKAAIAQGHSPAKLKKRKKRRITDSKRFEDCAEAWFAEADMADSTRAMRRGTYNRDIYPELKGRLLAEIAPDDLRALCEKVKARGAPATALHVRDVVKAVFDFAQLKGYDVENPATEVAPGTPANGVLGAARDFAREQFALKHRYALVMHTDEPHPHVHLVVKAMSEQGERLNIRKATLREWRREFARHLRDHGVEANATERAVRGQIGTHKKDGIYRAAQRGDSTHLRARAEAVADGLLTGKLRVTGKLRAEPGRSKLIETRQEVERGWRTTSDILMAQGHAQLAGHVLRFLADMPKPMTEQERLAVALKGKARPPRSHAPETPATR